GSEVRMIYEYYGSTPFASTPPDPNGYLLQRYMLHGKLHLSQHFEILAQLKSGIVSFKKGPPDPVDKDKLDLHQFYAKLSPLNGLMLKAGRQEVNYGRMVSIREGPNVRLSFDALKVAVQT